MIILMLTIISYGCIMDVRGVGEMDIKVLIDCYLDKARQYIYNGRYRMNPEDRNKLSIIGVSYWDAIYIVQSLTHQDYVKGPEPDHKVPEQEIYVFGSWFEEIELYIKLTFRVSNDLFIMSFHEAAYPMVYPFRT